MNPQRVHVLLRTAAMVMAAAAPVVLGVGLFGGLDAAESIEPARSATTRRAAADLPASTPPTLDSFAAALARPLRPPLARTPDAEPDAKAEITTAASPAQLKLVGTIGDSVALIRGPDGTVAMVEVGDDVDGADVLTIAASHVELRQNGRLFRLEKAPPTPGGEGITIR